MLTPQQFRINEAWIAIRVNEEFLFVKDEPYDIYVLLDAGSAYVLGFVLSRVVDEAPSAKEVKDLFKDAWRAKNQWAEQLILTGDSAADKVFRKEAERNGLIVRIIPISELQPIIGPLKELFVSSFIEKSHNL